MKPHFILTFDVDWAPDEAIEKIADYLIEHKIKATWFITHQSHAIKKLSSHSEFFEIGIHPNFVSGSTQGETAQQIITNLLKIVPRARSMRSHGLFQSSRLLEMARKEFNIMYDVSLFLPHAEMAAAPHEIFFDYNVSMARLPYFWEDDEELNRPQPLLNVGLMFQSPGLKVLDFHVIHLILNSNDTAVYRRMKKEIDYPRVNLRDISPYVYSGRGVATFFEELIAWLKNNNVTTSTVSGYLSAWQKKIKNKE